MHGYIDSIQIPLHLPPSAFKPSISTAPSSSNNGKGKAKATSQDGQYDVVANWNANDTSQVEKMVRMASLLGYSTLLLNISIPPTFDPSKLSFPTPLFPEIDPRTAKPGTQGLVLQLWRINVENYSDEAVKGAGQKGWYGFANSTAPLYPQSTTLLSVSPTTLTSFSHVALSLSPPSAHSPTLITLDPSISPRLPFPLKRGMISTLSRSGVCFEIVSRGLTRQDLEGETSSSSSSSSGGGGESGKRRRNWISGAREIVRATEGKGVILTSLAQSSGELRGPQDLINLCSLIGMPAAQAKDALSVNPQRAIMRGLSLRSTYRGVISNPVFKTYSAGTTRQSDSKMDVEDPTTTERADSTSAKKKRIVEGEGGGATSKVASKQQQDETTTGFDRESGKGRRSDGEGKAKKRKL